jgi:hypothetical protein
MRHSLQLAPFSHFSARLSAEDVFFQNYRLALKWRKVAQAVIEIAEFDGKS